MPGGTRIPQFRPAATACGPEETRQQDEFRRTTSDELQRENAALRERLSRLSQAGRRITESLDFDTVLPEVSGLLDRPKANRPSPVGRLP